MRTTMLSFVFAALLVSVLSTDAQNNIPDRPRPAPPRRYPGFQSYIGPPNYNPQVSDPGNPGYIDNAYVRNPSPQYLPPSSSIDSFMKHTFNMIQRFMEMWKNEGGRRVNMRTKSEDQWPPQYYQGNGGARQIYPLQPQGYHAFAQDNFGSRQGYFGSPQGYPGSPQDYSAQQTSRFPAQSSESAVSLASGTQQSNYGNSPYPVYDYRGSVPQQQQPQPPFPGQSLSVPNVQNASVPSAHPSSQYSAGLAAFAPPKSSPSASVSSGDVKLPGDSTWPASDSST